MKKKHNRVYFFAGLLAAVVLISFWTRPAWSVQAAPAKAAAKVQKQDAGRAIDVEGFIRKKASDIRVSKINSHSGYQATRSTFLSSQKSKLDADNAATQAMINRLKTNADQLAKIRAEAIQMNSKYASASPSEKARMDKRADELMTQLKNLGY